MSHISSMLDTINANVDLAASDSAAQVERRETDNTMHTQSIHQIIYTHIHTYTHKVHTICSLSHAHSLSLFLSFSVTLGGQYGEWLFPILEVSNEIPHSSRRSEGDRREMGMGLMGLIPYLDGKTDS